MPQRSILLGQSKFYLIEQVAVLGGKVALGVGVARVLGPDAFGRLELALSVAAVGSTLSSQWLTQAILRFSPDRSGEGAQPGSKGQIREAANVALLPALTVTAVVVGVAVTMLLGEGNWATGLLAGVYCLVFGLFEPFLSMLQAEGLAKRHAVWAGFGKSVGVVIALVLLLLVSRDATIVLIGMTGSVAIASRVLWGHLTDGPSRFVGLSDVTKRWLRFGLPLSVWFGAFAVLNVGDRIVLQAYFGNAAVGVYGASYRLVLAAITVLLAPPLMAGHPKILGRWHDDKSAAVKLLGTLTGAALCVGISLTGAAAVAGPTLVRLLVGDKYILSASTLVSLAVGFIGWQLSLYSHKGLEASGNTIRLALLSVLVAIANILLNLVLVPHFGVFGAAVATAASYLAYLGILEWIGGALVSKYTPWRLVGQGGVWILAIGIGCSMLLASAGRNLIGGLGLTPSMGSVVEDLLMAAILTLAGIWQALRVLKSG